MLSEATPRTRRKSRKLNSEKGVRGEQKFKKESEQINNKNKIKFIKKIFKSLQLSLPNLPSFKYRRKNYIATSCSCAINEDTDTVTDVISFAN